MPAVYDHLRPTDDTVPDGVYRVVGTTGESATLLRVGDSDGRRVVTGEVVTVHRDDLDAFEPAANPDGNRPTAAVVTGTLDSVYWSVRAFVQQLVAHPAPTAVALAFFALGSFGESFLPLPDAALSALVVVGGLGLAVVGSGRL